MNIPVPKKNTVCFGEILWDMLPSGKKPGGAPMNVAYHLHKLGLNSHFISSVGNDDAGRELTVFLEQIGLSSENVQISTSQKTSEVIATIGENHEVSYDIVYPVAWDFIQWNPSYEEILRNADAFVFGSLACRNEVSRNTLLKMLDYCKYRIFDVNLRAPHYSPELVKTLLQKTDMVKLNSAELQLIGQWLGYNNQNEDTIVELLFKQFGIQEVIVTKGSTGASYYTPSLQYNYPAYKITVNDTVGSGDSFLAAFISMKLVNAHLEETLDYAVALGAFITTQTGACPPYSKYDLTRFIWQKQLIATEKLQLTK